MASVKTVLLWAGRVAFFALIFTQCFLLVSYPASYKDNNVWYTAAFLYTPSVILWLCLVFSKRAELRSLFCVWALYVIVGLIPSVGIVFGVAGDGFKAANITCNGTSALEARDGLDTKTLGPIALKATLCITPLLLLLLLNTASDTRKYKDVVSKLCVQLAVDLLDAVEMIDIVLDEQEHGYGISKGFGITMIAVACFSFFLSPWPMFEINLDDEKIRRRTAIVRNFVEIFGVNFVFLGIRLAIVSIYEKDESIFIAKNIIAIILSGLEIYDLWP